MASCQEANIANSGRSIDLLYNHCMLSVLRGDSNEYTQHTMPYKKKSLDILFS